MHVLIVSRGMPDQQNPFMGLFEYDQAKALAKAGVQVTFFAVDLRSFRRKREFGIHSGSSDGVQWHRIDVPVGAVPRAMLLKIGTWALKKLYQTVFRDKNEKPDLIHAHFTNEAYMAAKLCEQEGIRLIVTEHSSEMNKPELEESLLNCAKYAYSKADAVIAVGQGLAANIEKNTGVSCTVIPNIMAADDFYAVKRNPEPKSFGFVFCGNLIDVKRPLLLLDAFRMVQKKDPDIRLGFIGDGSLRNELERKIEELNLQSSVTLYGRLPRNEIAPIYGNYDCFVLPSRSETFGVAYIEAMAAGLPVIATKCGGPEDFVTPEVGALIPVEDEEALVQAMEAMIAAADRYDSEVLKAYVRDRFSADAVAEKLTRLYLKKI